MITMNWYQLIKLAYSSEIWMDKNGNTVGGQQHNTALDQYIYQITKQNAANMSQEQKYNFILQNGLIRMGLGGRENFFHLFIKPTSMQKQAILMKSTSILNKNVDNVYFSVTIALKNDSVFTGKTFTDIEQLSDYLETL